MLPKATASGQTGYRARRIAIGGAAIAAAFASALFAAKPLPALALRLGGGAGSGLARYGGARVTWEDGGAPHVTEVSHVAPDEVHETADMLLGMEFHEVVESEAMVGLATDLGLDQKGHWETEPQLDIDSWMPEDGFARHTDYYLLAHSRDALDRALRAFKTPPGTHVMFEKIEPPYDAKDRRILWRTYLVADESEVTGEDIASAIGSYDPNTNRPTVLLDFTEDGAKRFGQLTGRIVGKKLATTFGDTVRSAPIINGAIRGGRAMITMGGSDPIQQEHERDALVAALRVARQGGRLPKSAHVVSAEYVAPNSQGFAEWLARLMIAIASGLVGALGGWLVARFARPERRVVRVAERTQGHGKIGARLAWTIVGAAVLVPLGWITLPGVNDVELAHIFVKGGSTDFRTMSVLSLGIMPIISAFIVVELAALVVPPWRKLRDTGPEGRRKLARAIAIGACLVAAVQAWFIATYMESLSRAGVDVVNHPGLAWRMMIVVTLVGATAFLMWLASIIGHRGLGNGYMVILVGTWLVDTFWRVVDLAFVQPAACAVALVTLACMLAIAIACTRWVVRAVGGVALPIPTSGFSPISDAASLVMLVVQLATLGVLSGEWVYRWSASIHREGVTLILIVLAAIAWSWVFARPARRRDVIARAGLPPVDWPAWWRATFATIAMLVAIVVIETLAIRAVRGVGSIVSPATTVVLVAAVLADLTAELRARRRAELVPVWPLHDPLLADVVRGKLGDIPHHISSVRTRSLLWFFGPYVPMMVLVPPDRAPDAEKILRELFQGGST